MTPFQSLPEYETFLYGLPERIAVILSSTLVLVRRGAQMAIVSSEIIFTSGHRLIIYEVLNTRYGVIHITNYGYEAWHGENLLYWYDSQPHPNNPLLAATHPHHKHVPPDIKHNRILAPGFSFTQPNLPLLIAEIEQLIQ